MRYYLKDKWERVGVLFVPVGDTQMKTELVDPAWERSPAAVGGSPGLRGCTALSVRGWLVWRQQQF